MNGGNVSDGDETPWRERSAPAGPRKKAIFVNDAAERWIIIECRDALEKQEIVRAIREVLGELPRDQWVQDGKVWP